MEKAPRRSWQYTTLYKKKLDAQKGSKISTNGGWSRLDRAAQEMLKNAREIQVDFKSGTDIHEGWKAKKLHKTMEKQ